MFYGLLSGIVAGLNTILLFGVLSSTPFISNEEALLLAPFVCTFLHDAFSAIWMAIYMRAKRNFISTLKVANTRSGRCIIIAALFAGPLGMTSYLLSIKYIGPAYTAIISSIYPAVGALLSYIFLKEKMSIISILGLFTSIVGIILLGYSPGGQVENMLLGFAWGLLAVLGWASEAVICSYGMRGNHISPEQSLQVRQLTSAGIYGLLIIPLIGGASFTIEILFTRVSIILIMVAFVATLGCILYYKSIKKIGATRAMSLNITYSAWSIAFGIVLLGNSIDIKMVICCILIIIGSIAAALKINYR